jgi:hypothetical protein
LIKSSASASTPDCSARNMASERNTRKLSECGREGCRVPNPRLVTGTSPSGVVSAKRKCSETLGYRQD